MNTLTHPAYKLTTLALTLADVYIAQFFLVPSIFLLSHHPRAPISMPMHSPAASASLFSAWGFNMQPKPHHGPHPSVLSPLYNSPRRHTREPFPSSLTNGGSGIPPIKPHSISYTSALSTAPQHHLGNLQAQRNHTYSPDIAGAAHLPAGCHSSLHPSSALQNFSDPRLKDPAGGGASNLTKSQA